jgi:hypothetical protein
MTTDNTTTDTPSLDRVVILMQALEELLHDLPPSPQATAMQVLGANVTTGIAQYQVRLFASPEGGAD